MDRAIICVNGLKLLREITIDENTFVAAGSIITRSLPWDVITAEISKNVVKIIGDKEGE